MKPNKYNPKAREAHARSLIDFGSTILKSSFIVLLVLPITAIVNAIFQNNSEKKNADFSLTDALSSVPEGTSFALLLFVTLALVLGLSLLFHGFKLLHDMESEYVEHQKSNNTDTNVRQNQKKPH